MLAKISSIRSKLPTAACWSWEKKRGNCEVNLLYVESDLSSPDDRVNSESESSDRVSGHLFLSNTIKMTFFDFAIYLRTVCITILLFFAKSEGTMAQQATTLI